VRSFNRFQHRENLKVRSGQDPPRVYLVEVLDSRQISPNCLTLVLMSETTASHEHRQFPHRTLDPILFPQPLTLTTLRPGLRPDFHPTLVEKAGAPSQRAETLGVDQPPALRTRAIHSIFLWCS